MVRLSFFLLAFGAIGVTPVLACRSFTRLRDPRTTYLAEGVPRLCRNAGILPYWYGPKPVAGDLRKSIKQLQDLIDTGCSDALGRFLCTAHYPQLDHVTYLQRGYEHYQRPCAEVCRAVWRDCRVAARNLNVERTPEFDCKSYPRNGPRECLPYLYPPRDHPQIVNTTRHNATSVTVLYAAPEKSSLTKTLRVRYNQTVSWGQVGQELFFPVSRGRPNHTLDVSHLKTSGNYTIEITAFNGFGEGPTTSLSIPAFDGNDVVGTACENITVPMCMSGVDYSQTAMPNSLGHWYQEDAGLEVQSYFPLVTVNCSSYTQAYMCALYTPRCTGGLGSTRLPCQDLCMAARVGCEEILVTYGFMWPKRLMCESLPRYDEGKDCYLGGAPVLEVSNEDECGQISLPLCNSAVAYNETAMPNSLGHRSVYEAELRLLEYSSIADVGCSAHFGSFVCSLYLPSCDSPEVLPCRELCEAARVGCEELLIMYGFQWPEQLACDDLPSHRDGATCYLGDYESVNETMDTTTNATLAVKPRRYDTHNLGVASLFRGWADVQGQGAANDYCRVVTNSIGGHFLSCSLAGMEGAPTDLNYNSTGLWFDAGHANTWYMMDVNGDGRDDYCRCVGCLPSTFVSCLLAGEGAFTEETVDYDQLPGGCHYNAVNPYFGR